MCCRVPVSSCKLFSFIFGGNRWGDRSAGMEIIRQPDCHRISKSYLQKARLFRNSLVSRRTAADSFLYYFIVRVPLTVGSKTCLMKAKSRWVENNQSRIDVEIKETTGIILKMSLEARRRDKHNFHDNLLLIRAPNKHAQKPNKRCWVEF